MKKKLALIVISMDECFPVQGFSGGGHKVTKNLILQLIASDLFDIDIFCKKSTIEKIDGINSIKVIEDKKHFAQKIQQEFQKENYDYVLSSDVMLSFANNLIHSNSSKFKSKNGKNRILQKFLQVYNAKKIKNQESCFQNNSRSVFVVSESLKRDYVENFNLDENEVFVCHPAVDNHTEIIPNRANEYFTVGNVGGGGLNKGGYLLLLAMKKIPSACKIKSKVIVPKVKQIFWYKLMLALLRLQDNIEVLPRQEDMQSYYKSIDCYVLPSLNEAFGLVVTEAASNSKPSIVSSTVGVRELIMDGENGFVFDRTKNPVKNLTQKLIEIADIYFNNNEKYLELCRNAHQISLELDWKKFTDTIIQNMAEENKN